MPPVYPVSRHIDVYILKQTFTDVKKNFKTPQNTAFFLIPWSVIVIAQRVSNLLPSVLIALYKPQLSCANGLVFYVDPSNHFIVCCWDLLHFIPHCMTSSTTESHYIHMIDPVVEINKMSPIFLSAVFYFQTRFQITSVPAANFFPRQRQETVTFFAFG